MLFQQRVPGSFWGIVAVIVQMPPEEDLAAAEKHEGRGCRR
jgi:hypothetical protein